MVCTCYSAIKLEKFTEYSSGQIAKYKSNNKTKEPIEYTSSIASNISIYFQKRKKVPDRELGYI